VEVCHVESVSEAIADLGRRGATRILCEGGPTLNAALFGAELVDEIFLTIAPKLVGGHDPLTLVKGDALGVIQLELRSFVELEGELYLKYGVMTNP
jgi:riboflavin biosynthesis pyrimidine reductase